MESDYYSLSWDNFHYTLSSGFESLLKDENLVDVTLAADGKIIKAHKTVLSICSSFFKDLFKENPCQHPIIILPNVDYNILCDLLRFMYQGEVSVSQDEISSFLKVAEMLKIQGLTDKSKNPILENNEKTEIISKPKNEPSDDFVSMDYEEKELEQNADFADNLLKTEENSESDDLGESSTSQSADTDFQLNQSIDKLPDKSREKYLKEYSFYKEWCTQKNLDFSTEQAMSGYLNEKSKILKPTSIWAKYSMLKATLATQDNIHINFPKIIEFLKSNKQGSVLKRTRTFTKDDVRKFFIEAPDDVYLMMKLVLLFGLKGGCRTSELTKMSIKDIEDKDSVLIVRIPGDRTTQRTFLINNINNSDYGINPIDIYRRYVALRSPGTPHKRFFVKYRMGRCSFQVVGINTMKSIPRYIAKFLQKPNFNEYTGYCFRQTSKLLKKNAKTTI